MTLYVRIVSAAGCSSPNSNSYGFVPDIRTLSAPTRAESHSKSRSSERRSLTVTPVAAAVGVGIFNAQIDNESVTCSDRLNASCDLQLRIFRIALNGWKRARRRFGITQHLLVKAISVNGLSRDLTPQFTFLQALFRLLHIPELLE